MATTIKLKNGSGAPLAGDLVQGEPALDLTNKRLYTEDSGGTVIEVGTNPSTLTVDNTSDPRIRINNSATSLSANTVIGGLEFYTNDASGGGTGVGASIDSYAQGNFGSNQQGLSLRFSTRDSGSGETNTERMRIDSSGNVGIGTTNPLQLLHISKASADNYIRLGSNGANDAGIYFNTGADWTIGTDTSNSNAFDLSNSSTVGGASKVVVTTGGNVGIGTASPSKLLETVATGAGSDITALQVRNNSSSTSTSTSIRFVNSTGSTSTAGGAEFSAIRNASDGGALAFKTAADTTATLTERMRIDSSGNVGIGTSSPSDKLHVYQNSADNVVVKVENASSNNGSLIQFSQVTNGSVAAPVAYVGHGGDNTGDFIITNASATNTKFYTNNTERMRIDTSGNVGIGTTSPSAKLHAAGNIHVGVEDNSNHSSRLKIINGGSAGYEASLDFCYEDKDTVRARINTDGSGGRIEFHTFDGSLTERMRIAADGNVGIGTSSPASKLTVNDDGIALRLDGTGNTTRSILLRNVGGSAEGVLRTDGNMHLLQEDASKYMRFSTANTERMRITSSGNTLMGLTSDYYSAKLAVGQSGGNPAIACRTTSTSGTVPLVLFTDGNSQDCGSIDVDASANTTNYGTSSDQRLKENIVDAPAGNIDDVRVRSFDWKSSGHHQTYGLVAQELVDVAPEAVSQGKKEEDTWKIDYSKLVPMMIKEIQDLKAEVAALKGA